MGKTEKRREENRILGGFRGVFSSPQLCPRRFSTRPIRRIPFSLVSFSNCEDPRLLSMQTLAFGSPGFLPIPSEAHFLTDGNGDSLPLDLIVPDGHVFG